MLILFFKQDRVSKSLVNSDKQIKYAGAPRQTPQGYFNKRP